MENTLPTFKEIRGFLKPWLDEKTDWSRSLVKIYRENKNIVVKVCYSVIYHKTHEKRPILEKIEEYLTKAGFTHNNAGTFKRKENLVES